MRILISIIRFVAIFQSVQTDSCVRPAYQWVQRTLFQDVKWPGSEINYPVSTVLSESRCALRSQYVDLVVSIEIAVEVCCCFTVFSC
jgi:hypothetical protein